MLLERSEKEMDEPISAFTGEYHWLSNFARSEGLVASWQGSQHRSNAPYRFVPTVEHGYQASKCVKLVDFDAIAGCPTPSAAKRMGRRVQLVSGWDEIKLDIMLALLRQKFSKGWFAAKLLETGTRELIEGNTWGDTYWGVCRGSGQNHLGRLLMLVRGELRRELQPA